MTPEVCVAGEILWDLYGDGSLAGARRFTRVAGGAAANVALGLTALGVGAAVSGVVGRGALGHGLAAALAAGGVDVSGLLQTRGQSGLVFIETGAGGAQRYASYRPSARWPARLRLPESWRRGSLAGRWLHLVAPDVLSAASLAALAARAVARGARLSVDLNARPRAWPRRRRLPRALLAGAALVKASRGDLRILGLDAAAARGAALGEHARAALGLAPEAALVVTDGAARCRVSAAGKRFVVAPPPVTALRSVGAGDAFATALLAGLCRGEADWRELVARACAHAAAYVATP